MIETIITSSILILFVIFLRFVLRGKISRRLMYALWLIVAVRLLIPISFPSPISVMNVVDTAALEQAVTQAPTFVPEVPTNSPVDDTVFVPTPDSSVTFSLYGILFIIWTLGVVAVGLWFLTINLSLHRKFKATRTRYYCPECSVPVYVSDSAFSPCLFGLFRPAIYVSSQSVKDEFSARCVLTHELCHYRQFDHIWSAVRILCVILYWYNPLVWVAAVVSKNDCELSCDELSVRNLGEEYRLGYGEVLLNFVSSKPTAKNLALAATTMTAGKRNIKERISMIAKSPKTLLPALIALILTMTLIVGCTFTGSKTPSGLKSADNLQVFFPAYTIDNPNNIPLYDSINNTPKFSVTADFPETWEFKISGDGTAMPLGELYSNLHIFDGENCIGYIGFNVFEPYTEEIEQAEYHKTVWPTLRMSRMYVWDPFVSVKTTENGESGVVNIMYLDPEKLSQNPSAMAEVPEINTNGILAYDKQLKVYVGMAFVPETVNSDTAEKIAKSLVITAE